jgi:hypothetical protein
VPVEEPSTASEADVMPFDRDVRFTYAYLEVVEPTLFDDHPMPPGGECIIVHRKTPWTETGSRTCFIKRLYDIISKRRACSMVDRAYSASCASEALLIGWPMTANL